MATLSAEPSRNPFRSNPVTPNATGSARAPSPIPPSITVNSPAALQDGASTQQLSIPDRTLGLDLPPDEEPPPYTVRPSELAGETTLEQGPRRPFQPAPVVQPTPPQQPSLVQTPSSSSYSSYGSSTRGRRGGLLQQLTGAINEIVDNLDRATLSPPPARLQRPGWGAYPGQTGPPQQSQDVYAAPPPRHPASASRSAVTPPLPPRPNSSDFARDFYAAGGDVDERALGSDARYAPPPGPPPAAQPSQSQYAEQRPPLPDRPGRPSHSTAPPDVPDDGSPTTRPAVGHPLLKDGKILVYPTGYECDKCHNIGYKKSDPLRPCKRCWKKYAKPFSGPLAYSFSSPSSSPASSSTAANRTAPDPKFQRPLRTPPAVPPPIPPAFSRSPPEPHYAYGGYMPDYRGGFRSPPPSMGGRAMHLGRPPPGSVVYTAGDPRIGGRLCWRCEGTGNVSFLLLDRMTCEVCGGIGRVF